MKECVKEGDEIGSGNFCLVKEGIISGVNNLPDYTPVAIKVWPYYTMLCYVFLQIIYRLQLNRNSY